MTQLERLIEECKSAPQPDVLDALNLVVRRRIEREHEAERASKHAAILPLCRGAREKLVRLRDIELPGAAARVWQSWQALEDAQQRLWKHQANKPAADDYPSGTEIAAYDELTQILESEAAEARAEKISAEQAQAGLIRNYLAAAEDLAKLQRQESALRPKVEEPHRSGFSLAGVR